MIACHQAGACNVVATLGTALTTQHVQQLRRYCEKVVLIFDADDAGQKAADRAVEVFLAEDLDVGIAVLPDGHDPDSLMKSQGGLEKWKQTLASSVDALAYQFARIQNQMQASSTVTGRQHIAEEYIRKIARLGLARTGAVRRGFVVRQLVDLLGLPEATITSLLREAQQPQRRASAEAPGVEVAPDEQTVAIPAVVLAEKHVIGALLESPELFHTSMADGRVFDETLTPSEMVSASAGRLYQIIYEQLADEKPLSLQSLLADLAERGYGDLAKLAIDADREINEVIADHRERLTTLLVDATQTILTYHSEQDYQQVRRELSAKPDDQTAGEREAQLLRRISEKLKASPSPTKIAVVKN